MDTSSTVRTVVLSLEASLLTKPEVSIKRKKQWIWRPLIWVYISKSWLCMYISTYYIIMSHKTKEVWRGFIPDLDQLSSDIGVFGSYTFSQQIATRLKFNSSPLTKRWSEAYFPCWDANFSGPMLNFGGLIPSFNRQVKSYATFLWISGISNLFTSRWGAPHITGGSLERFKTAQVNNACRSYSLVHPQITSFFLVFPRW